MRMRTAVMTAAADRRATLMRAATVPTTIPSSTIRATPGRSAWRRPMTALVAAVLTLGILAGTALASRAGGPLYDARIWLETANLPTDLKARATAEVERLEARLEEARQAAAVGDGQALEAALEAYSSIVLEAALGSRGDAAALATIEVGVTRHVAVLTGLAERVPGPAQAAMLHALASSSKVLDDIDKPPKGTDSGAPGQPGSKPTDKPAKPTPDAKGGPAATGKPDKTTGPPDDPPGNPDRPDPSRRP
jgi:hypothetical protein